MEPYAGTDKKTCTHGHKLMKEIVYVFDVLPQLRNIFQRHSWQELQTLPARDPNIMSDIRSSSRYREKMGVSATANSPRTLRERYLPYIFCTDGVPVTAKRGRKSHSMWPFFLDIPLTPFPYEFLLLGIISGPKLAKNCTAAFAPMKAKLMDLETRRLCFTGWY